MLLHQVPFRLFSDVNGQVLDNMVPCFEEFKYSVVSDACQVSQGIVGIGNAHVVTGPKIFDRHLRQWSPNYDSAISVSQCTLFFL